MGALDGPAGGAPPGGAPRAGGAAAWWSTRTAGSTRRWPRSWPRSAACASGPPRASALLLLVAQVEGDPRIDQRGLVEPIGLHAAARRVGRRARRIADRGNAHLDEDVRVAPHRRHGRTDRRRRLGKDLLVAAADRVRQALHA